MLDPVDVRFFKMAVGQDRIKTESPSDIACRCPICGDSKYSKSKARLHLYENNGRALVNCFNECSCNNKTVYAFLRDYYPNLLEGYKQETFKSRFENISELNNKADFDLSIFEKPKETQLNDLQKPTILFDLSKYFTKSDIIDKYVEKRGIIKYKHNFYLGKSIIIDNKKYPVDNFIIIPFYCGDKWYGFYSRSLTEHKFYTYIPDKNSGLKIWNLYNIDVNKPVYVFEGIFDALSAYESGITNVIACCGATPNLCVLKDLDLVFCLDNDRTGKQNAMKYAKKGYKVLVYPDNMEFKDMNEMLLGKINIKELIDNNIYSSILAEVKIQRQL